MTSLRMLLFLGLAFAAITAVVLQGRTTNLNPFVALDIGVTVACTGSTVIVFLETASTLLPSYGLGDRT